MSDDAKKFWVAFNLVKGIGPARLRDLIDYFGNTETAWFASYDRLRSSGLSDRLVDTIVKVRNSGVLDKTWEYIHKNHIDLITWEDENYPRYLKEIEFPPPLLYVRGVIYPEDELAVAVVGTRRVTSYGRQAAITFTSALAQKGITIVSGLARGVDTISHQTVLDTGGRTFAVLGCGIDRIYPPEHRNLAKQIVENGAILSDYPPGTPPDAANFPARNRIISGLSRAVVVIEAGSKSGALITATFAAEQGREVFALPGSIYAPQSKGTNLLIQQGATPLLDPKDIIDILNPTRVNEHRSARVVLPSDAIEAQLFTVIGNAPLHVDEIHAATNLPIEKITSTLTLMELKGIIQQVGNMHYVAVRELEENYRTYNT